MLCAFVVINIVLCLLYTRARFLVLYNFVSCELTCLLYRMQGYRVVAGTLESEESYYKRISGIIRLYAAIIQYPVPKDMVSASVSMGPFLYTCFFFSAPPPWSRAWVGVAGQHPQCRAKEWNNCNCTASLLRSTAFNLLYS